MNDGVLTKYYILGTFSRKRRTLVQPRSLVPPTDAMDNDVSEISNEKVVKKTTKDVNNNSDSSTVDGGIEMPRIVLEEEEKEIRVRKSEEQMVVSTSLILEGDGAKSEVVAAPEAEAMAVANESERMPDVECRRREGQIEEIPMEIEETKMENEIAKSAVVESEGVKADLSIEAAPVATSDEIVEKGTEKKGKDVVLAEPRISPSEQEAETNCIQSCLFTGIDSPNIILKETQSLALSGSCFCLLCNQ